VGCGQGLVNAFGSFMVARTSRLPKLVHVVLTTRAARIVLLSALLTNQMLKSFSFSSHTYSMRSVSGSAVKRRLTVQGLCRLWGRRQSSEGRDGRSLCGGISRWAESLVPGWPPLSSQLLSTKPADWTTRVSPSSGRQSSHPRGIGIFGSARPSI